MIESGWGSLIVKGVMRAWSRIAHDPLLEKIDPEVDWRYDSQRGRYDFSVAIENRLQHKIWLDRLELRKPSAGALRHDPRIPLRIIGGPTEDRDKYLGSVRTIMSIEEDVRPGAHVHFEFVFQPPADWSGGVFKARLYIAVKRSREVRKSIPIVRTLSKT